MTDGRSILATIVQSSTVELFRGLSLAVAPRPQSVVQVRVDETYVGASIAFSGKSMNGNLLLWVPKELLSSPRATAPISSKPIDLTRELSNQLLGRIKNRLLTYKVELHLGLPSAAAQSARSSRLDERQENADFAFQSLRGDVWVTLRGRVDYSAIAYSGGTVTANEGDVILF
jgi:hypothetical protein